MSDKPANTTFIIAEAGVNHNGELDLALQMIDVAANAGADAIKFQTFTAESLTTEYADKADYQKLATNSSESQQEMLRALELPQESYSLLLERCQHNNIEFMSTAFDERNLDFLVELGIRRIKVPSGELTNVPLLRHVSKHGLPVILSTGMANMEEIEMAINVLVEAGLSRGDLTVLHCNTAYPTPFIHANLQCIASIRSATQCETGYSDHTLGEEAVIAAVALGAIVIEKHFTLDRNLPGPDQRCSLEPIELADMVKKVRHIEMALGDGEKQATASEIDNIAIARKSIVASCDIAAGDVLSEENMTTKRPATGISAAQWDSVVGTKAIRSFAADEQIELD